MSEKEGSGPGGVLSEPLGTRLLVLEMTVAAIAARLPQSDLEEVVAMLVFVAKGTEAANNLPDLPVEGPHLLDAGHFATEMLDRIAQSRRGDRAVAKH